MSSKKLTTEIKQKTKKHTIFYVTREVERASAGLFLDLPNYKIITNNSPYSQKLKTKYPDNIIISKSNEQLDTLELLQQNESTENIKKNDFVLVFKNTLQIEKICKEKKWKLLNPSAKLASEVEEKISQIKWLGSLSKYLPKYKIDICKNIKFTGKKFILQFNRSHTGSGTTLITSKKQLSEIQKKFPLRDARIAEYIPGPLITNNNIVWENKIFIGNLNYQITGLKPFTDLKFATIGNDWALPHKILNKKQIAEYKKIATAVGKRLAKQGWKGLFGIDVVMNEKTGKLYLLEINARQPASTTYESELQIRNKEKGVRNKNNEKNSFFLFPYSLTTFEAHLASLLDIKADKYELTKINDGAQIIQRVINPPSSRLSRDYGEASKKQIEQLRDFNIIEYNNSKPGSDLLRIQSEKGIMKKHNKFNEIGLKIMDLI